MFFLSQYSFNKGSCKLGTGTSYLPEIFWSNLTLRISPNERNFSGAARQRQQVIIFDAHNSSFQFSFFHSNEVRELSPQLGQKDYARKIN